MHNRAAPEVVRGEISAENRRRALGRQAWNQMEFVARTALNKVGHREAA